MSSIVNLKPEAADLTSQASGENGAPELTIYGMAGHLIRRLQQKSTHVFQQRMKAAGIDLTSVQFAALDAIRANPGIDQASVASLIAYDRATIGGVIDRLEQKGLITREVSKKDRRARELALSTAGQALYTQILPLIQALQSDILTGLTDTEKQSLLSLIAKTTNSVEA